MGAAPANAVTSDDCGPDGTLISAGVCEQTFDAGTTTFTVPTAATKLEVLLVGAGGAGADQDSSQVTPTTTGYAAAGGGGDVQIFNFDSNPNASLTITVAQAGGPLSSTVTDGVTPHSVQNGDDAATNGQVGGASGSGKAGAIGTGSDAIPYGAGGGAGASPLNNADGGAGVTVSDIGAGTLFAGDGDCFGGGGAIGIVDVKGEATCGGGEPTDDTGATLVAPALNSGGGGGGLNITRTLEQGRAGSDGFVSVRWQLAPVTFVLTFAANGHGTAPAPQTIVAGQPATKPADPTADGFEFKGWFADAALTIPADFSAPVTSATTFYASWAALPALAATGGAPSPVEMPIGIAALVAGAGLFAFAAYRRKRKAN
ncbi:MAG: hypothetical protein JWO10_942 [Microbacteriaceae bacterium]|nr:hypothetical protein [Microbacteriaceae bacterium]